MICFLAVWRPPTAAASRAARTIRGCGMACVSVCVCAWRVSCARRMVVCWRVAPGGWVCGWTSWPRECRAPEGERRAVSARSAQPMALGGAGWLVWRVQTKGRCGSTEDMNEHCMCTQERCVDSCSVESVETTRVTREITVGRCKRVGIRVCSLQFFESLMWLRTAPPDTHIGSIGSAITWLMRHGNGRHRSQ